MEVLMYQGETSSYMMCEKCAMLWSSHVLVRSCPTILHRILST